jgi:hypothetical protein
MLPLPIPLEAIEDAEIIVIDTPEKVEPLESQFTEVDEEYHDSKSNMDIDSDDPTTEPDTDTEISERNGCVPFTTRQDREELRVVRNNFAEEYDPWDTSMVPEYAEDIFRYMRELEVPSLLLLSVFVEWWLILVSNDSQWKLYDPSKRIRMAHEKSLNRLDNPSPRKIPSPPRNSLPHNKHHRPFPHTP